MLAAIVLAGCGSPSSPNLVLQAGSTALSHGDCKTAMSDFSQYVAKNPGNATAITGLAQCYSNQGLWGKAISLLVNVSRTAPSMQIFQDLAQNYWSQGEAQNAYSALLSAARAPGATWFSILGLASSAASWQGYSASIELLKMVPTNLWTPSAYLTAGNDAAATGSISEALDYYNQAVAKAPSYELGDIWYSIGNSWFNILNYGNALHAYQESLKVGNVIDKEGLYLQLANTEIDMNSLKAAEAYYTEAVNYATTAVQRYGDELQLGELMLRMGNISEGKKILVALTGQGIPTSIKQQASSALKVTS